jgi:SAM-dependent methyltransferase
MEAKATTGVVEWSDETKVASYLDIADTLPRRAEAEATLIEFLPETVGRVLDLGTGDGRTLAIVLRERPEATGVGLDMSPPMLAAARRRFAGVDAVHIGEHDLTDPLPDLGRFDLVVSSFAIHHTPHERKRALYGEIWDALEPGGTFLHLEHVASATPSLQLGFLAALDMTLEDEDKSNILLDVETQLGWLREIGFADVDCYWKWRELAVFGGWKATSSSDPQT